MDDSPGVVIWRVRRSPHFVSCVVEQVGEDCFELHLFDGHELILTESFEETDLLLARAEELRIRYAGEEEPTTVRGSEHDLVRS